MIKLLLIIVLLGNFSIGSIIKKKDWLRPQNIPSPKDNPLSKEKILFGKKLFFDPILSRANNISCASCHNPLKGWSDADTVAIGDRGKKGKRNSPSILNSAYQFIYFWDGRVSSLEEQALKPLLTHVEMNLDPKIAVQRLQQNPMYKKMFLDAFKEEGISTHTLAKALASFERTIVSKDSRFDLFLKGDTSQLTAEETKGFYTFVNKGNCTVCHSGFLFSDQSFNNIGINNNDIGRAEIKKRELWKGAFKTPSLRNVANSAPYFHDGSVKTLAQAVTFCAKGSRDKNTTVSNLLLDKHLDTNEINQIVTFLHTLNEPVLDLD